jgi:hypothetical protein
MSIFLDNATRIKDNIIKFIEEAMLCPVESFSIDENGYETGYVITCHYKTIREKVHYISADYLYNVSSITMKVSSSPNILKDFYLFFASQHENKQLHVVKSALEHVVKNFNVGAVHIKFGAQAVGELYHNKKTKIKHYVHKEILQGKISFEVHLREFAFTNSRIRSMPYYYLEDGALKSSKMLTFVIDHKTFSINLKQDEDFIAQLDAICLRMQSAVLDSSAKTICKKFELDMDDVRCFADDSVRDYITLMSMETI